MPIRTLVLNQVLQPGLQDKYLATRRADQQRALERLRSDPQLAALQLIEAPLFDLEVGGVTGAEGVRSGQGAGQQTRHA